LLQANFKADYIFNTDKIDAGQTRLARQRAPPCGQTDLITLCRMPPAKSSPSSGAASIAARRNVDRVRRRQSPAPI
jgi:hypothetical protein